MSRAARTCAALAVLVGCARLPPATAPAPSASPQRGTSTIAAAVPAALDAIFLAPEFAHTTWGVRVDTVDEGHVVYRLNDAKLMMTGSNVKLVTLAVAAERLGWDFRFETRLVANGTIVDGVLRGDLVVIGGGDPTIRRGAAEWSPVFDDWVKALSAAGIGRVDGRVIGDDHAFASQPYGINWAWDDIAFGYSAPLGALQYDENAVELQIVPAARAGELATVRIADGAGGLAVDCSVRTVEAGTAVEIGLFRMPGSSLISVAGSIPVDAEPVRRSAAVDNPTRFFVRALRRALSARGIPVSGDALDLDDVPTWTAGAQTPALPSHVIATHASPPLREMGMRLMKASQNLYAETLLARMGAAAGAAASVARGRAAVAATMTAWGLPDAEWRLFDGSGLSRRNFLTPSLLVSLLQRMARDARHARAFEATLPVAGQDGTLDDRMKGTAADGNARAKTGSMGQVRALSGYVTTASGAKLAFSIVANGFDVSSSRIDDATDRAVALLAAARLDR